MHVAVFTFIESTIALNTKIVAVFVSVNEIIFLSPWFLQLYQTTTTTQHECPKQRDRTRW